MKRAFAVTLMGIGLAFAAQGCNSSSGNNTPPPAAPPATTTTHQDTGPAWTLTLKSQCADGTDASDCLAYYGFAVDADGHYKVGPSPDNNTREAMLQDDDRTALAAAIKPFLGSAGSGASVGLNCTDVDPSASDAPTTTDTITLTKQNGQAQTIVTSDPSKFCSAVGTPDQATALYSAIEAAANTYYLLPFPDACLDAAASLAGLYGSLNLKACNADTDCAYIASDFSIIPADNAQFVAEDDCSQVSMLVVANATAVATQQQKLTDALGQVQDTCGDRMWRSDCLNQTGFDSSTGAPACVQHVCTKNPAAHADR